MTYGVETKSTDLVAGDTGWNPATPVTDYTQIATPNGDGTETVTITLLSPVSGKRFARVSVTY